MTSHLDNHLLHEVLLHHDVRADQLLHGATQLAVEDELGDALALH